MTPPSVSCLLLFGNEFDLRRTAKKVLHGIHVIPGKILIEDGNSRCGNSAVLSGGEGNSHRASGFKEIKIDHILLNGGTDKGFTHGAHRGSF